MLQAGSNEKGGGEGEREPPTHLPLVHEGVEVGAPQVLHGALEERLELLLARVALLEQLGHLLGREAVDGHAHEVVVVRVGARLRVGVLLVAELLGLVDVARDVRLCDLGERAEVALAQLGDDVGALAVRDDELARDDELDEARLVAEPLVHELELADEVLLALVVKVEAHVVEVAHDVLGRRVLLDLALRVEADHVARVDLGHDLEHLLEAVGVDRLLALGRERHDEVHVALGVVLLVVLQGGDDETFVRSCSRAGKGKSRGRGSERRTLTHACCLSVPATQPSSISL